MKKQLRLGGILLSLVTTGVSQGQVMTQTLTYTGSAQTFTLPSLCTSQVTITCFGAGGASGSANSGSGSPGGNGGNGARVTGIYNMANGTVLNIYVGGAGSGSTGGFNGGGNGSNSNSGAGGGASDVRTGGTGLGNRVIVAAGGGGGGNGGCYSASLSGGNGGNSGVNGSNGANSPAGGGGFGGSGVTGGAAGTGCTFASGTVGGNGTSGIGGSGGTGVTVCSAGFYNSGGGGGGGYVGGGGGGGGTAGTFSCTLNDSGGGGGGSGGTSYTSPAATSTVISNGINSGNGYVVISYFAGNVISVAPTSTTICSGNPLTLTASGVNTYTWVSPASNNASVSVSPGTTTSYTVRGTNGACTSSAVATVSVNASPVISLNSNSTTCAGSSVVINPSGASTYTITGGNFTVSPVASTNYTVNGTASNGCVSISPAVFSASVNARPTVSVTSGSICSGNTFTIIPSGAGTYTVTGGSFTVNPSSTTSYSITGTSAQGCLSSNTAVSSVTVNATPTVAVNSGTICSGSSFTMAPTGASTYTYSGGSAVVNPGTSTTYSVTGISSLGCVSSNTAISSVTVHATPIVTVNSGTICSGTSFTMVPGGASTYTYSNGNAVVSPTMSTTYSVTGTSVQGCVSSNTAISTVTVNTIPVIAVNNGAMCAGSSFTMVPSGAATYTYSNGSSVVSPTASTSYSVTGTSAQGCAGSNTAIASITVNALPSVSLTAATNTACINSASIALTGSPAGGSYSGTNVSGTAFTPVSNGTFTPAYSFTNAITGCSATATTAIVVSVCMGIEAIDGEEAIISMYPNPNNGVFTIALSSRAEVSITNAIGSQVLVPQTMEAGTHSLSLSDEANGIYVVKVMRNGKQSIMKFMKQ